MGLRQKAVWAEEQDFNMAESLSNPTKGNLFGALELGA